MSFKVDVSDQPRLGNFHFMDKVLLSGEAMLIKPILNEQAISNIDIFYLHVFVYRRPVKPRAFRETQLFPIWLQFGRISASRLMQYVGNQH